MLTFKKYINEEFRELKLKGMSIDPTSPFKMY